MTWGLLLLASPLCLGVGRSVLAVYLPDSKDDRLEIVGMCTTGFVRFLLMCFILRFYSRRVPPRFVWGLFRDESLYLYIVYIISSLCHVTLSLPCFEHMRLALKGWGQPLLFEDTPAP
jgi:hypothetical protein